MYKRNILLGLFIFVIFISGCAVVFQPGRRSDIEKIKTLEDEVDALKNAKTILEEKLFQEIKDKQVRLKMEEKGLVITFVAEVLFDSGKAILREESLSSLSKVAGILNEEVRAHNIGIEGHTDNEPIRHSGWKSNWELSVQRALSVLHYLEDSEISPTRLVAMGYGEYKSVASNDTEEGKQLNRRVEIVILPRDLKKTAKSDLSSRRDYGEYK
ncbi:MAG: OmpA family protein [Candidatus Omnitrophota bacterium]|nr:MAG: OmpA family protein [Candidatus Omnitrophota bacterium]